MSVEPVKRSAVLVGEVGGNPDNGDDVVEACGIGQELPEAVVISFLK